MGITATQPRTRPEKRIPGEAGVWIFLFGDMGIFLVFFITFLVERSADQQLYTRSSQELGLGVGVTNTLVLLASSLAVVIALAAARRADRSLAVPAFGVAMGCGAVFVVLKAFEYTHLAAAGHGPDSDAFFTWYFVLTGLHLLHVLIGLGVLVLLIMRARRIGESNGNQLTVLESGSCFWHLVDLLWMVIFPLLYLVA